MTAASLPNGWAFLTLENFTSNENNAIKRGPFGSAIKKEYFVPSGYKVYEQKNAIYNDFNIGNYFINESKFQELKDFAVKPGDIIISCSGTIGKLAIIPQNAPKGIINQALLKLSLDTRIILTKYFSYLFTSDFFQKKVLKNTRGTAIKNLESVKALKQIPFPIAPLNEQKRIINKVELLFSFLDTGVAQLRLVQGQLKRYRQAVLKAAFTGKLTQQWRMAHKDQIEPAQKTLETIKWKMNRTHFASTDLQGLPKLPDEWAYTKLGDICASVDQVNPRKEPTKEVTYLEIASIDSKQRITAPTKYLGKNAPSRARQLVKTGDILFSTVRTYLRHIALIGEVFNNNIASTGFCVIRPLEPINRVWLFNLVQTDNFINPLTKIQRGTSYPAVRKSDVFDQIIPFAPSEEQKIIAREIEKYFSQADETQKSIEKSLQIAQNMRHIILKHAFEGKLVPQDSNEEPAEKLLERIKAERLVNKSKNNQVELSQYVK